MRIVSLLPSATEIICSIGLQPNLVGISHECDYPPGVSTLPVVTRSIIPKGLPSKDIDSLVRRQLQSSTALYSLNVDTLRALEPDLIVSQSLCDVCAVAADEVERTACTLASRPRILNLEPTSLQDVFDTMLLLGQETGRHQQAQVVVQALQERIACVRDNAATKHCEPPTVAVLEWLDPLFNAGHWTPELVTFAGGIECLGNPFGPATAISWDQLANADPDVIVIALCGFDVARSRTDVARVARNPTWRTLRAVRKGQVHVMDGNAYFSRPGPRLVDSAEHLQIYLSRVSSSLYA